MGCLILPLFASSLGLDVFPLIEPFVGSGKLSGKLQTRRKAVKLVGSLQTQGGILLSPCAGGMKNSLDL